MKYGRQSNKIMTDDSLMETVRHGNSSYPFHYYYENLAEFDFNCIEWHWHVEVEFVLVEKGTVRCEIGEKQFSLLEGDGLFVNSRVLHRFYSEGEAVVPNFVCHPVFIAPQDSLIFDRYVLPVLSSSLDCQTFEENISWQAEVLTLMRETVRIQESDSGKELLTSSLLQKIWYLMYENLETDLAGRRMDTSVSSQARVQLMMQYIHQNLASGISLRDIADQALVSKSTALNLFRRYLHTTPVGYLNSCRLKEAARLLAATEKNIKTISKETGFNHEDYFCRKFKQHYKVTPTEYRKDSLKKISRQDNHVKSCTATSG